MGLFKKKNSFIIHFCFGKYSFSLNAGGERGCQWSGVITNISDWIDKEY